jgi:hypothetical protein
MNLFKNLAMVGLVGVGMVYGEDLVLPIEEKAKLIEIGKQACLESHVPASYRSAIVTESNGTAIVTFKSQPNERAGDFIIRIDRTTGRVLDKKFWR